MPILSLKILMFALMIFVYIQTIPVRKNYAIPFAITIGTDDDLNYKSHYIFRPELVIPKRVYLQQKLDRMELLTAPPFCDIADELIENFQDGHPIFTDLEQFKILKAQFKVIGYNFNLKPICLWHKKNGNFSDDVALQFKILRNNFDNHQDFAEAVINLMSNYQSNTSQVIENIRTESVKSDFDFHKYKMSAGVYFFLNSEHEVIYVGKAKNIRKRLQSHFSNQESGNHIDYTQVHQINVEYSGNDVIAQLIESENIKALQPKYNVQQISDSAPFIINEGITANGIYRLKITRKDIVDNMPERFFNRNSVKETLQEFCKDFDLCRKHCGLEIVKGPCSKHTVDGLPCVCSGDEAIDNYNKRFILAFQHLRKKKTRILYKLKGRNQSEDAFVYVVNGIYEGYGFIDKDVPINNVNDILGHLNSGTNNYETSRIIGNLKNTTPSENVLLLTL